MGATTFSLSKKNRARKARAAGKLEEAEVLEKSGEKFRPKADSKLLEGLAKDQDDATKPTFDDQGKIEVDLDGDGKADVVISKA